jgi:DNA topoisomerase-3
MLVLKDGGTAFEFVPREKKGKGKGGVKEPKVKIDFTGKPIIGKCPKCGAPVYDTEAGYLCEKSQADSRACKFKLGKEILQRPIDVEQAKKLIETGKTDLLDKFISKAGKPFSAYLVMDESGKVTFEFPPREDDAGQGQ